MGREPYHIPKENLHLRYLGNKRYNPAGCRDPPGVLEDQSTCRSAGRGRKSCSDPLRCWLPGRSGFNPIIEKEAVTITTWGNHEHTTPAPNGRQSRIMQNTKHRIKEVFATSVKHQSGKRRTGVSHSKLRKGKCIGKKGDANSLVDFDANQRLMASRFRGASRFFGTQSEFTC